jgi:hypothetical protein
VVLFSFQILLFTCSFSGTLFQWLKSLYDIGGKELEGFTIPYNGHCSRAVETVQCTRRCLTVSSNFGFILNACSSVLIWHYCIINRII